ncbi:MAG: flagellar basal body rod protein FlgC [Deltaproteobacteria bacterium]|nr:flagellar basal body rod protein FlgC [Deltaproteobacteria bacterium]MCZ6823706.1 flagellar basal body rod protein FlgC [Deltaproteobacteria bacterium]
MSFFTSLRVNGSALAAERLRVDLASANLANANSTRTAEGGPYRRRDPILQAVPLSGSFGSEIERAVRMVNVRRIVIDQRPPREVFNPSHPDADGQGIVRLPNVQIVEETVNLMNASRAYEANLVAISISREMAERAMRMGKS